MTKATRSTLLPRKIAEKLRIAGEQIRLARLRRNYTIALVADRAQCSELTVSKIERGEPTVSMGAYLRVLYAMQLADDIELLAKHAPPWEGSAGPEAAKDSVLEENLGRPDYFLAAARRMRILRSRNSPAKRMPMRT